MARKKDIQNLRRELDRLDARLLSLLSRRVGIAREIGARKRALGLGAFDPKREEEILARLKKRNPGPLPAAGLQAVFCEVLSAGRSALRPLRVGFTGPGRGAGILVFGRSSRFRAFRRDKDLFRALESGKADYGILVPPPRSGKTPSGLSRLKSGSFPDDRGRSRRFLIVAARGRTG